MLAGLIKSHLLGKSYFSLLPAKASLASFLSGALASLASLSQCSSLSGESSLSVPFTPEPLAE